MSSRLEQALRRLEARRPARSASATSLADLGDGFDLSLVPGETELEKLRFIAAEWSGGPLMSIEARNAARKWFELLESV